MTKPKTISREKLVEAVKTLGLDHEKVTQIYIDSYDIDVFYIDKSSVDGKSYECIRVIS